MATVDMAAFIAEATAFLDSSAEAIGPVEQDWGEGEDQISAYARRSPAAETARLAEARRWKALEFDAGFGWLTGPVEHGGAGLTSIHQRTYIDLRACYRIPPIDVFAISLGMVAPAILQHAQPDVAALYLRQMHRGEMIGCQLFSEPGAGSDIAGLSTRAERDGDGWVVSGQKVWTSGAHQADVGLLLARTDPDAPKHRGITAFAVPMRSPGIEVRPLTMMTGGTEFNEVFFNDVRVSDHLRLGAVNEGWGVALTVLMNERALGSGDAFGMRRTVRRLLLMARQPGLGGDRPELRQRLAALVSRVECIRYQSLAADARRRSGLPPGPAESLFKLANTEVLRLATQIAGEMLGPRAIADSGEWGTYSWSDLIQTVPGYRVAGGTDEVMRNILAERVLGLPKEPSAR